MSDGEHISRRGLIGVLPGLLLASAAPGVRGQARYPSRPVTIVVASPPGGQSDLIARYLGDEVGRALGQTFLVDNKPGASGIVGLQYAARQRPDGYTLAYGVGSWMAVNPGFFPNLPYDPVRDFVPITQIGTTPQCLMLGPHVRASTLAELIAIARKEPGRLTFGSFGNGSTSHLQAEMLKMSAGLDMLHVPFKGSAQALTEVVAGRIDFMIIDFAPAAGFIRSGHLKPLAVTGTSRYPEYPQVPTFQELGHPLTLVGWNGLFAPAGTPTEVVEQLNRAFNEVIRSSAGRSKLLQLGAVATGTTSDEYRAILIEDIRRWGDVIRRSGAKPD
ncbi:MAG: tripartite tricarboxylate transporter substrate binding protein [Burkholderiaceae bacterium]